MDIIVPFTKEILFKSRIAEICSISLEEDVSINEHEILGDFILDGEYITLDINVDTTPFHHVIPFSVSLDDNVDRNTLSYEINDFSYDILNDDILKVSISFHVSADVLKNDEPRDNIFESSIDDDYIEEFINDNLNEKENDVNTDRVTDEVRDDKVDSATVDMISSNNLEDDYISYHVHIVKIDESIETICEKYNIDKELIYELNDVSSINLGDKLLIPLINDEI